MKTCVVINNERVSERECFAFFDTVMDRFELFDGIQVFESLGEFESWYSGDEFDRYARLVPERLR